MTGAPERPWKTISGGLTVNVRVTPKGGRDVIDGITPTGIDRYALRVRVRAAPADGEANAAVVHVLARAAGVPPSAVKLLQGAAGRLKTFRIAGDPAKLAAALEQAIAGQGKTK